MKTETSTDTVPGMLNEGPWGWRRESGEAQKRILCVAYRKLCGTSFSFIVALI